MRYHLLLMLWTLCLVPSLVCPGVTDAACPDLSDAISLNKVGEKLLERSEFQQAVDAFNQMLGTCCQDEYCMAVAKFYLGRSYLELGDFDKALGFADSAEAAFSALNKPVEAAKSLHVKARIYSGTTDYEKALSYFASAQEILSRPGQKDESELFWLLANRAKVYIYLSNYVAAGKDLDAAQKLLRGDKDPTKLALLSEHRGLIDAEQQNYDKARKEYQDAFKYYQSTHNLKGMSAVLSKIGHISESRSDYETAQTEYQDSLNLAREFSDASSQAFLLNNLGNVYTKRGNYEEAVRMYSEALKIRGELGIRVFYGETLNNLGVVDIYYGKYPDALKCFSEAYRIAKEADSPAGQAWALHNMAWVFKDQGNLKDAESYSQRAVELARKIQNSRLESTAVLRLGNLYEYYGDFDGALKQYELSAEIQRRIGDRQFLSNTLFDMATVDTRLGKAERAEKEYTEALKLKKQIGIPLGEILCKFALFYLEKDRYANEGARPEGSKQSDLKLAGDYIKQAENIIRPDEKNDLMLLSYVKGRYLLEQDPAASLAEFNNLRSQADAAGSLKFSFLASVGLGLSYEKLKKWAESEKAFEKAVNQAETIRNTLDPVPKRTFLDGEEILGVKHILPYQGLARVRLRMGNATGSLEAAEFTKARSFADKMVQRAVDVDLGVDKKLLCDLNLAERQMASTYRQLQDCTSRGGDATAIPALLKRQEELGAQLKQIEKTIELKYPDFYAVRFPRPLSADKSALKPDEVAIAYEVTDPGLLVYLIQGKKIVDAKYEKVPKSELDSMVHKFRQPFEGLTRDNALSKLKSFNLSIGKKLYDLLLGPVLAKIEEGKQVVVVPDGSLTQLPFEMLVADKGGKINISGNFPTVTGTRFFADRNDISYNQSITALTLARGLEKKKTYSQDRVLIIANPVIAGPDKDAALSADVSKERAEAIDRAVEHETVLEKKAPEGKDGGKRLLSVETYHKLLGFDELPETKVLADDLLKTFGNRADVYSGTDATMEVFSNQIAPKIGVYDKVVFATHGYFGEGLLPEIQEPVLLFSLIPARADNLLKMSAVMNLNMNADLVTLLACQSGVGKYVSGEGTLGMGRAFQYAGSKSVLMSLWSVAEESSVKMVSSLFRHINQGKTKLEALKLARAELRSQGYDHPFFWAAFILVGEPR